LKILIVDDSSLIRDRLYQAISPIEGITSIDQASNGGEALILFWYLQPDIVVLDIAMPQKSGIDVLDTIKHKKPATKVIILTNYPSDQFRKICSDLGADFFFDKAEDFHEVASVLKDLVKPG
jgi:YesN/AraC family two-component response regulator